MTMSAEDALASVAVMRNKEETDYYCEDYITRFSQSHPSQDGAAIDEVCRRLMADWCLKVVDRCGFTRETAAISMNMLDRFLATPAAVRVMKSRNLFQLASMTSLYTAIKIHEAEALQPETIVQLSRGIFTVKDIEEMEITILFAIQWRTNPPTPLTFVQHFLETVPDQTERKILFELAKSQIELVISNYSYVMTKPSSIAYAALSNAVDMLCMDTKFLRVLAHLADVEDDETLKVKLAAEIQEQLPNVVAMTRAKATNHVKEEVSKSNMVTRSSGESSPREVRAVDR